MSDFLNRSAVVCLIIMLGLVSVGCGELKISASTGDASGSSGYTEFLGAKINDQILETTALSGSSLSQSFQGSGDRAETFSVTNNLNDQAGVGFDIKNSKSYSGSYMLSPKTANYAKATEKLDVNLADSIFAFAYATTRDLYENAYLDLSISKGSLVGYTNSAYATKGKATVEQKMKSASGESIWCNEMAGKGLDYNDLDYFVGETTYSLNPSNGLESEIQNEKIADDSESATSAENIAQLEEALLNDYSGSATATNKMAQKKRTAGSFSADWMNWGSHAFNSAGENADSLIQITSGQLSKYSMTATASQSYVDSIVKAGSANGDDIDSSGRSYNSEGDNSIVSITDSGVGSLKNLYLNPHATLNKVESLGKIGAISGLSIMGTGTAFNAEGDRSQTEMSITNGYVNNWNIDNQANRGKAANPYLSLSKAQGSYIDVQSHAMNANPARESLVTANPDGTITELDYNSPNGYADFELITNSLTNAKIESNANSNNALIKPTLPKGVKTAIILEPNQEAWSSVGITDLGTTVVPTLVEKGYATLRYRDSGASADKFQKLGNYDVVLVKAHMDSSQIYLSNGQTLSAKKLAYKTTKKQLAILDGCESFAGFPKKSALAESLGRVYLEGGFAGTINVEWSADYISSLFEEMGNGETAGVANTNALAYVTAYYGSGQYNLPLQFYGKDDFKL